MRQAEIELEASHVRVHLPAWMEDLQAVLQEAQPALQQGGQS
jgi:hypothetical protein